MATVLDPNNPTANFQQDGLQTFTAGGSVLTLLDQNKGDFIAFYAADTDAAAGTEIDVIATFRVVSASPNNADASNRVVINDGLQKSVIAACIVQNGVNGIGLYASGSRSDPAAYPVFVPVDWAAGPVTIRLRRTAGGDGEIVEINGAAPSPRALLLASQTPPNTRNGPSVEFGPSGVEAECTVEYTVFRSEKVEQPPLGKLNFTRLRLFDSDSVDRIGFRADYTLASSSSGIDPTTEPVTVKLSTPSGGQFYPAPDFNPLSGYSVQRQAPRRRWTLSDAERARTGIEQMVFDEDPNNMGSVFLRDFRTTFDNNADYSTVNVEITIGSGATADKLVGTAKLVQKPPGSKRWRLSSEP